MKKIHRIIKRKTGDVYIWKLEHYGAKRWDATRCCDNNKTVVYPTSTDKFFTQREALENLRK